MASAITYFRGKLVVERARDGRINVSIGEDVSAYLSREEAVQLAADLLDAADHQQAAA